MLRRRILTSAMASVMALTSVAVVASADETTEAVANVKTKADLEAYVKSFDSFRSTDLDNYGSISGEHFVNTITFCENVLADDASTVDDYTSAYLLLQGVYNKMTIHTAQELKALVESCTKIYDTNNILNEELSDAIYKENDVRISWSDFVDAYDEAESVLNSGDSRIITDAYEVLADAKGGLTPFDTITKAQFRNNLKALETALKKEYSYNAWDAGTVGGSYSWAFGDAVVAFGTIFYWAQESLANTKHQYDTLDSYKNVTKTSIEDIVNAATSAERYADIVNNFTPVDTTRGSKAAVQKILKKYNGQLVHDYATTDAENLFQAILDAGVEVKAYVDIDNVAGTGEWVETTKPVWYIGKANVGIANGSGMNAGAVSAEKDIEVSMKIKAVNKAFYVKLDADGYVDFDADGGFIVDQKPADGKYKVCNKNVTVDLADFIKVDPAAVVEDVDNHEKNQINDGDTYLVPKGDFWYDADGNGNSYPVVGGWAMTATNFAWAMNVTGNHVNSTGDAVVDFVTLDAAMALANFYLTTTNKDAIAAQEGLAVTIYDIDDAGKVAENSAKGSSSEWTLVYSYLKRALEDKYAGDRGTHTKKDVEELIDKCYELAEATGDAAIFHARHTDLVTAREDALAWDKEANRDKKYKENVSGYTYKGQANITANSVYDSLNGFYGALEAEYKAFKYSFGEIFDKLAEISDMADSGDIQMTDAIKAGLEDVAYKLATVQSLDDEVGVTLENDAFTSDGYLNRVNRLFTNGAEFKNFMFWDGSQTNPITIPKPDNNASANHDELKKAYEALLAEVAKQTDPEFKVGDVNKDGKVDSADASLILQSLVGLVPAYEPAAADFNADGVVNSADASAILKSLIGL